MSQGLRALLAVARVEMTRLMRVRVALTLIVLVPIAQILLFGYAIRPGNPAVTVAVAGPSPSVAMDAARQISRATGARTIALAHGSAGDAVKRRVAAIAIEVPRMRSFADPLAPRLPIRVVVDASDPQLTEPTVAVIETTYWRNLVERADLAGTGPGFVVDRLYNPDARTDWAFLPALVGVTVMIAMLLLGTLQTARERETGSWEATAMLPLSPALVLAGRLIPYSLIGAVQGLLVLLTGAAVFGLPVNGSVIALALLLLPFAGAHYVLGSLLASRAKTQIEGVQAAVAFYLPAMLLSGFLYPFATLPGWARAVGEIFPLTHMIRAARAATLRGDAILPVLAHGAPMLLFFLAVFIAAMASSRAQFD